MDDTLFLRFLYKTVVGRCLLKIIAQPAISKIAGCFLDSKLSKVIIPYFTKKNNIVLDDIDIPNSGFSSFNDFFKRKKKVDMYNKVAEGMISPCDGFLSIIKIDKNSIFDIKHTTFTVDELLGDKEFAEEFYNGMALIYRLTPANYHRYCYITDGKIIKKKVIPGKLYCVRPIATRTMPVFVQNAREYQVINSEKYGNVVQMEIGATMVGKITNNDKFDINTEVKMGEEKGYFEFGGSTIVVLLKKDVVGIDESFIDNEKSQREIIVNIGQAIAK